MLHTMAFKKSAKRKEPSDNENVFTFDLDKKKQVSVRQFNGVSLVDIREFYIEKDTQERKPGKKGIVLTEETWLKLLEAQQEVSAALSKLKGDKRQKREKELEEKDEEEKDEEEKKVERKKVEAKAVQEENVEQASAVKEEED